jgi:small-conductance mechanosensitive channel
VSQQTYGGEAGRHETEAEKADRNFNELLQELRVSQMGVQILFAFLLTLAFQGAFADVTTAQLVVYVATLMLCAGATALLIAPVALHRAMFRQGRKREVVERAAKCAQGGLFLLFLAICGAILFILDFILARSLALSLSGVVMVVFLVLWFVVPWSLSKGRKGE